MTYCKEFSALLDPYIDGELSPEETARVRRSPSGSGSHGPHGA